MSFLLCCREASLRQSWKTFCLWTTWCWTTFTSITCRPAAVSRPCCGPACGLTYLATWPTTTPTELSSSTGTIDNSGQLSDVSVLYLNVLSGQIGYALGWYHWIGLEKDINRYRFFVFWSWIFDKSSKFWAASCKKESNLLLVWMLLIPDKSCHASHLLKLTIFLSREPRK